MLQAYLIFLFFFGRPVCACRADAVQQELQVAVDKLPPAGNQARQLYRTGGEAHHPPPGSPWQQVLLIPRFSL